MLLSEERFRSIISELANILLSGVIAGGITGAVVGGLGSRLAMRISGIMSSDRVARMSRTEAGARVGEITFGGTLTLVIFGTIIGIIAGLFYIALRQYLPKKWQFSGLAFGLLLLAIAGSFIIEGDNRDFRIFGSSIANVLMFISLFPLFGLLLAYLVERFERSKWFNISNFYLQLVLIFGLSLLFFMILIPLTLTFIDPPRDALKRHESIIVISILGMTGLGILAHVLVKDKAFSAFKPRLQSLSYLIVGSVVIMGIYLDIQSLMQIFR